MRKAHFAVVLYNMWHRSDTQQHPASVPSASLCMVCCCCCFFFFLTTERGNHMAVIDAPAKKPVTLLLLPPIHPLSMRADDSEGLVAVVVFPLLFPQYCVKAKPDAHALHK